MHDLTFIRHAPVVSGGRLYGRLDLPADVPNLPPSRSFAGFDYHYSSPALRCRQTAAWLLPTQSWTEDLRLLEQDFGTSEGRLYADLPDLGTLSRTDLAKHHYPQGESFEMLAARVVEFLMNTLPEGRSLILAHSGTIRAALGLALGDPASGLGFEVAPLSVTRLKRWGKDWSIAEVNGIL